MRILHTADWHLGDRLGRIDRTQDLRLAVEKVADYCRTEQVDVLLVAGDLFSEVARPDALRETIEHWQKTFGDFLTDGGTILTLTGNHDNETFCQTLNHAMNLATPTVVGQGEEVPNGRLYLATEPTLLKLRHRTTGLVVQFVLMPYPTPTVYLVDGPLPKYCTPEERNKRMTDAFVQRMRSLEKNPKFDAAAPSVFAGHLTVTGADIGRGLFRLDPRDDIVLQSSEILDSYCYAALGHIHKPQAIGKRENVRYSGSIERLDLGESNDQKGVVIVDIDRNGMVGSPRTLPLKATTIYEVQIDGPTSKIDAIKAQFPDAENDLVKIYITYKAGEDNLEQALKDLEKIFPRWYLRNWHETSSLSPALKLEGEIDRTQGFATLVREYVQAELVHHPDVDAKQIMLRLESLLEAEAMAAEELPT